MFIFIGCSPETMVWAQLRRITTLQPHLSAREPAVKITTQSDGTLAHRFDTRISGSFLGILVVMEDFLGYEDRLFVVYDWKIGRIIFVRTSSVNSALSVALMRDYVG